MQSLFQAAEIVESSIENRNQLEADAWIPGSTILASSIMVFVSSSRLAGRSMELLYSVGIVIRCEINLKWRVPRRLFPGAYSESGLARSYQHAGSCQRHNSGRQPSQCFKVER